MLVWTEYLVGLHSVYGNRSEIFVVYTTSFARFENYFIISGRLQVRHDENLFSMKKLNNTGSSRLDPVSI